MVKLCTENRIHGMMNKSTTANLETTKILVVPQTDEDVVHRKYFCVNNHLVSLVELLLEAEENFQFCLQTLALWYFVFVLFIPVPRISQL